MTILRLPCAVRVTGWLVLMLAFVGVQEALSQETARPDGAAILQELRGLRVFGSVLYIAAHPDDENNELITYWARGRGYRTAYLSLTRGDGGQNLLGPDLGERLGVARTQELLAARRIDGGQQFFTRAIDFGFSKNYQEALNVWDHQKVLGDVVRVIRLFRPDVIVTRFSPEPGGTHGHHTASAVLALEAFRTAGDPNAFPEQLGQNLTVWQPKRILQNVGGFGGRGASNGAALISVDVSGSDAATGESFAAIAARSRAMHKTQGFDQPGTFGGRGAAGGGNGGTRTEAFQLLAGEPAQRDIMEGVETTWSRIGFVGQVGKSGVEIGQELDRIIAQFNVADPAASVPALLQLRTLLVDWGPDMSIKRRQIDRIIVACLGLEVQTVTPQAEVVPGERFPMRHVAVVRASVPVRWRSSFYLGLMQSHDSIIDLQPNRPAIREDSRVLAPSIPLTQPFWLQLPATAAMFEVENATLIGPPDNEPLFPVWHWFEIGGQTFRIEVEPVQSSTAGNRSARGLDVIAPVSLRFTSDVRLFSPGSTRAVAVDVAAVRPNLAGAVQLQVPAGWRVTPASIPFRLTAAGSSTRLTFEVSAPAPLSQTSISASATVNGRRYDNQRIVIDYQHIPLQLLQPAARVKAVTLDLAIRGRRVGYLPGAGDDVAESIEQMGYAVTQLTGAESADQLRAFDAVVLGVRAFNVRTDLDRLMPALFAYAENGGTVIVQYNVANGLRSNALAPFPLQLSADRVTDENAAATILAPDHPVLNSPNRISTADFTGWVQERGLYFPNQWDSRFTPILAFNDAGEPPTRGSLLIARHGRGHFVYTGLSFFRQLPAGVPGAYRLFANLLSLGSS